jgi:transcriptional regulator with XRE-family HTH domain
MAKKQKEDLADFVRRILKDKNLTTRDVEERARRKGKSINNGYVSRIVSRTATNLTVDRLKALALGLGVRQKDIFDRVLDEPLESEAEYQGSDFALLFSKYQDLTDEHKKEVRMLIKAIERDIEWRLSAR